MRRPHMLLIFALYIAVASGLNFSFPSESPWTQDISAASLDSNSANIVNYLFNQGIWGGADAKFQIDMSFNIQYVTESTSWYNYVMGNDYYSPDCDSPSTFPVTVGGLIEGESPYDKDCSGDCHYLVVDSANNKLYENYHTLINTTAKTVTGECAVVWDLCALYPNNLRGEQCTSTDAAGFPIAPLLATADELAAGSINHALRFILPNGVMSQGYYVHPASHAGGPSSTDPNAIIYGTRLRLKSSFDISSLTENPISPVASVVVDALKKYGMFLADGQPWKEPKHGGNIPLCFADDTFTTNKYADLNFDSHALFGIQITDFEVVAHDTPVALTYDCVRNTISPGNCSTGTTTTTTTQTTTTTTTTTTSQNGVTNSATKQTTILFGWGMFLFVALYCL